ncbi:unnamed protein product [Prunus brigantina]
MNATYQVLPLSPKTRMRDHIDFLMEITMKEGIVAVKLMERPTTGDGKSKPVIQIAWLLANESEERLPHKNWRKTSHPALGADGDEGMRPGVASSTM